MKRIAKTLVILGSVFAFSIGAVACSDPCGDLKAKALDACKAEAKDDAGKKKCDEMMNAKPPEGAKEPTAEECTKMLKEIGEAEKKAKEAKDKK